jgi:hypothetical protein
VAYHARVCRARGNRVAVSPPDFFYVVLIADFINFIGFSLVILPSLTAFGLELFSGFLRHTCFCENYHITIAIIPLYYHYTKGKQYYGAFADFKKRPS